MSYRAALLCDDTISRFDGQTDGRTDGQTHGHSIYRSSIASRGKKTYTVLLYMTHTHTRTPLHTYTHTPTDRRKRYLFFLCILIATAWHSTVNIFTGTKTTQTTTRRLDCVEWHDTVFAGSGPLSVHKLFISSTMPSVTCLRLHDVSVICRVTYFQFPILLYIGHHSPGSISSAAYYWF